MDSDDDFNSSASGGEFDDQDSDVELEEGENLAYSCNTCV